MPGPNTLNLIYGLIDPKTGQLRYIRQTIQGMKYLNKYKRLYNIKEKRRLTNWLKSLNNLHLFPEIIILEDNIDNKNLLNELEIFYISYFKGIGCNLVNLSSGGNSNSGYKASVITKRKLSILAKNNNNLHLARDKYFKQNKHPKWHNNPNSEIYKEHLKNQAQAGGLASSKIKSIAIIDQFNNVYKSQKEAAITLKLSTSEICKHLQGKSKAVKGYTFKRA